MASARREQSQNGVDWAQMESIRKADLRSDFRDLTPGRRIEQGIELSRLATALAGKARGGGASGLT